MTVFTGNARLFDTLHVAEQGPCALLSGVASAGAQPGLGVRHSGTRHDSSWLRAENSASQVSSIIICSNRWEAQVCLILYAHSSNHLTVKSVLIVP